MTCPLNGPVKANNLGFIFGLWSEQHIDRIAGLSNRIALRLLLIPRDDTPLLKPPRI